MWNSASGHSIQKYHNSSSLNGLDMFQFYFHVFLNCFLEMQTVQIDTICVLPPNLS